MIRPLHGRRAKRAQWLADAADLRSAGEAGIAAAAHVLRRRSEDRRWRRIGGAL